MVTLIELTGCAVGTYEANEATASIKFVASVKTYLAGKVGISSQVTTNQLLCFRVDIVKVIRQTYTHTWMHTNIHIQRYRPTCTMYIHSCIHAWIQKWNQLPQLSHRPKTMGKWYSFIHSGYCYRDSLSPLQLRGAPNWHCVGVYTPKRYRQLYVKGLPKVPGVASRAGFEPKTFRSKGIDLTNVPPRPTNINR